MEMKPGNVSWGLIATTIVFSCLVVGNLAQEQQQQSCMHELRFCIKYLNNSSQPSDTCCQPLDYVVKSIPECLCSLMRFLGVNRVEQARIDVLKAQTLLERCGQYNNSLGCITGTSNAQSNNPIPTSVSAQLLSSSFVVAVAASSLFLNLQAL